MAVERFDDMDRIPRQEFIKRSTVVAAALGMWPLLRSEALGQATQALPNFVVYLSDDHGRAFSSPYGDADLRTPNLDRLAAEGAKFTQAFNASPTCCPSRSAMLTGLWPARNGAEPNHKAPRPETTGLPGVLKKLGYEMAAFGKVAHGNFAHLYDFDVIKGPNIGYEKSDEVAKYLAERDASKPLCLFFGSRFPHVPWAQNEGYDPDTVKLPPTLIDTPQMRQEFCRYCSSVTRTDALLGEVRAAVQKNVPGETLFIYTTDHGAQLPFAKWNLYDAGTRVPFIAHWPGHLAPRTIIDAMICLPDLLPTLIELAGGKAPDCLDGKSFAGVLRGQTKTHRDRTFATHSGDGDFNVYPCRSLRKNGFKYILNLHPEFQHQTHISRSPVLSSGMAYWQSWLEAARTDPAAAKTVKRCAQRPAEELYNLGADPFEIKNLADDPVQANRLAEMRAELQAWMKEQGDTQTVYGHPLLIGQEVTLIHEAGPSKKPPPPRDHAHSN
jgi:arylsulfatase A-like enzyme